jgi:hypothetical protein
MHEAADAVALGTLEVVPNKEDGTAQADGSWSPQAECFAPGAESVAEAAGSDLSWHAPTMETWAPSHGVEVLGPAKAVALANAETGRGGLDSADSNEVDVQADETVVMAFVSGHDGVEVMSSGRWARALAVAPPTSHPSFGLSSFGAPDGVAEGCANELSSAHECRSPTLGAAGLRRVQESADEALARRHHRGDDECSWGVWANRRLV